MFVAQPSIEEPGGIATFVRSTSAKAGVNKPNVIKNNIGLIAQEVEHIVPDLVNEDNNGVLSVNYTHTVALLIEAVKTLRNTVNDLQDEIKNLKNNN